MGTWWKLFLITVMVLVVCLIAGLVLEHESLPGLSIGLLIGLTITGGLFSLLEYRCSFSNVPLLKAELRTWINLPKATLEFHTEKGRISTKPEKIEISVDSNAEVVLLTVGDGRFCNTWDPHPVIVTVPSEEIKEKWHERIAEAQKIAQKRYKKAEKARRKSKEDLLPKPDKIPTIRPIKKDC